MRCEQFAFSSGTPPRILRTLYSMYSRHLAFSLSIRWISTRLLMIRHRTEAACCFSAQ